MISFPIRLRRKLNLPLPRRHRVYAFKTNPRKVKISQNNVKLFIIFFTWLHGRIIKERTALRVQLYVFIYEAAKMSVEKEVTIEQRVHVQICQKSRRIGCVAYNEGSRTYPSTFLTHL